MWTYICNPDEITKKKITAHPIVILLVAAIITAIASAILSFASKIDPWMLSGFSFLGIFLGGLYMAYILKKVSKVIGGKDSYYDALFTLAYPAYILSVAFLILAILTGIGAAIGGLALGALTFIGIIIALPIFAIGTIVIFRYLHDFLGLEWIQALIIWIVIMAPLIAIPVAAMASAGIIGFWASSFTPHVPMAP